jgi:hypothetical protein
MIDRAPDIARKLRVLSSSCNACLRLLGAVAERAAGEMAIAGLDREIRAAAGREFRTPLKDSDKPQFIPMPMRHGNLLTRSGVPVVLTEAITSR